MKKGMTGLISSKMIHICFVNKFDWLGDGPMGKVSVLMCHALSLLKCKVTLHISGDKKLNIDELLENRFSIERNKYYNLQVIPRCFVKKFNKFAFRFYLYSSIIIFFKKKPDERLIIITRNTNYLPFLWVLKKLTGALVFFESHSFHNRARAERKFLGIVPSFSSLQSWIYECAIIPQIDGVICMSKRQRKLYKVIAPDTPSVTLPLGSYSTKDGNIIKSDRNPGNLVYCGGLNCHVDLNVMLAALEICQCENVRLTWYGLYF
jgi:hypothetical protein